MSTSQRPLPEQRPSERPGAGHLLSALEYVPAAIYCLTGSDGDPVWTNARARALGTTRAALPTVDGASLSDAVDEVLRTGHPLTLSGSSPEAGGAVTAMVRPIQVDDGPGVLLVVEPLARDTDPSPRADAHIVEQMQHALLPDSLPLLPDLPLSGSYHRASSVRAAGGDWYDAVPLGRGRLALVIGDAVGHGVPAAGAMSRLRGAIRSSALRDPAPEAVLSALDEFGAQMDDIEGASIFYGVFDAGTGELAYASAGHPPPLVVHADGTTTFLPANPRPPLGSMPGIPTTVLDYRLERGDTLVLYSDGALVMPGGAPAGGPERLAEVAATVVCRPGARDGDGAGTLAAAIASDVHGRDARPDDVAVLVAHRNAARIADLQLTLPATPSSLPVARRRVSAWLGELGTSEQDKFGIMVAVGEACANAAEHAYRGTEPGEMHLSAGVDVDGVLTIVVRDEGSWQPPDRDPGDRGRGLLIMRQLVDRVLLEGQHGTKVTLSLQLRRGAEVEEDAPSTEMAGLVTIDREGPLPFVRVAGVVDVVGAEQMRIRLLEASRGGTTPAGLDLAGVGLFSSAAVRVVLAMARIARDENWTMIVFAADCGVTRHILEISGLAGLVDLR